MDQETLVINRIDEARKLIDRLAQDQDFLVTDAYWMEDLEFDGWTLHIASPKIDEIGIAGGYGVVTLALENRPEIHVDIDEVRPERTDTPAVIEVRAFLRSYPATEAFRLKGVFLKGHFVQRAYIYPVLLDGKAEVGVQGG